MADIFISYIHEEGKIAEALQRFLKAKLGDEPRTFLSSDKWQVFAGDIWLDRIREELGSSKFVILMLSKQSVARPWVNFEAGAAWLTGKIIIPVCYGGLSKGELPKPYSGIQALDLEVDSYYLLSSISHHLKIIAPVPYPKSQDAATQELNQALQTLSGSASEP